MQENQHLLSDEQNQMSQNASIYQEFYTKKIHIENETWCEEIEKSVEYQQQLYKKYKDHIINISNHQYDEKSKKYIIESYKGIPLSKHYMDPNQIQNQSQCIKMIEKLFELDQFMKKEGIHHFNIKPNNIILYDGMLKLTDFGFHNQYYLLRNFHQIKDQNFCSNNYPYLSNQVLQKIQQYSQCDVNQDQDFLTDIRENLDKIYDDSDSQSIASIMLEILMNQSIIRNSSIDWKQCDFKQLRQSKYEEVINYYKNNLSQNCIQQFMELYILDKAVDFSMFEQCNKLIDKFIQLNNFQTFEQKFMYLFNGKQLKSYYENCRNNYVDQQNTQFVLELQQFQEKLKSKMKSIKDFQKELISQELKLIFGLNLLYQQIKCQNTQYDKNYYRLLATIIENGRNVNDHLQKYMDTFILTFPDLKLSDWNDEVIEFIDIDSQINLEKINECRQFIKKEILDQNLKLNFQTELYYLFSQSQLENYQIRLNNTIIPNILQFAESLQNNLQNEQEFMNLSSSFSKKLLAVNLLYDKTINQNNSQQTYFNKLAQQVIQQDNQFWQRYDKTFSNLKSFIENSRQSSQQPPQQSSQLPSQPRRANLPPINPEQINLINQQVTITQLQNESVREFLKWLAIVQQRKYKILESNIASDESKCVHYEGSARSKIAIGNTTGNAFSGEVIESQEQQKAPEQNSCFGFCQQKQKQKKKKNDKYELISKKIKIIKHYEKIRINYIDDYGDWKIFSDGNCQITWYQLKYKVIQEKNITQQKTIKSIKKIKFYQGEIFENLENGEGQMCDFKKNIKYNGLWYQGKKKQNGTLQILNPKDYLTGDFFMYEGEFDNDQFHGKGKVYLSPDKKIMQTGQFQKNNQVGIHSVYQNNKLVSKIIYCSFGCCRIKINIPFCILC